MNIKNVSFTNMFIERECKRLEESEKIAKKRTLKRGLGISDPNDNGRVSRTKKI